MRCPKCNSDNLSVIETRTDGVSIRRRRECEDCTYRFSTYERIEYQLPMVVKKDGRREPFKSQKLRDGLIKACEKRPVSLEQIDATVEQVERSLSDLGTKEIDSHKVGEFLMEALKKLDPIAYVRFASVYEEFDEPKQFIEALETLQKATRQKKK